MVGVAQGWVLGGFCKGVGGKPDSCSASSVDPRPLATELDSIEPGSLTGG